MKNKRALFRKIFTVLVVFAVLAGNLNLAAVFNQTRADSDPLAISVSSDFSGKPLLGGTATISVTITNTGDERGYNVSLKQLIAAETGSPGTVSFVSATVGGDSLPPSSVFSDAQGLHLSFDNFTDLEPSESVTIRVTVQLDDEWSVGDLVVAESLAKVNTMPDDTGVWIEESVSAQAEVIPIMVVSKSSQQSTGVEQATGTEDRVYRYSISVQNNYLEKTNDVSLVDALPDGLEFLGIVGVWLNGVTVDPDDYPFVFDRDSATGITDLSWQIGDMDPGDNWRVEFESAVRYDYYGTDNGGTNRVHNDFTEEDLGTPVPNKTPFENTAELSAWFQGEEYTDSDTARITGAYATIEKGVSPGTVGNGTIVTYTITFYTSEYYSLDDIVITDILPDGQTYIDGSSSIEPDSVEEHADGTTTLIWDTLEEPVNPSESRTITFQAVVDEQWVAPPFDRENIVSGDRMTNQVDLSAQWTDQVDDDRPGGITGTTASGSSAGVSTGRPRIEKQVSFDGVEWVDDIELTVGDVVYFRMRFNTTDGTTPYRSDIRFGDISMVDWLPRGMMYLDGTYTLNYAGGAGIFISPGSEYDDPPQQVTIGDLDGLSWWLGDIEKGGWWEVTFQAEVVDIPLVAQGVRVANHAKMAGENSFLRRYSDRDVVDIDYIEPSLTLGKTTTENKHWVPGEDIEYELVIENTGGATAWNLQVTDILPVGMREFDPSIDNYSVEIDSVALTPVSDYTVAYDQPSGTMTWTFLVPLGPDEVVTIIYNAQVDDGIAAGTELDNIATAAWSSQDDGGRHYPGSDDPSDDNTDDHRIRVRDLEIVKTGPAGPVTIGDRLDYSVELLVPAGTVAYWPEIQDRFNAYGVEYVAGSAELQLVSGDPVTPATLVDATPSVSSGAQGQVFSWLLENYIDNSGSASDYVFRLSYQVDLTGEDGGSWEYWIPADNHQLVNTAEVRWNTINSAERATNRSEDDTDLVAVIQPYLLLDKEVITPGPYRGGDVVEYHVSIVNAGYYDAHNVIVVDNLPAGLASTGLVAQLNGVPLALSDYDYASVGGTVTVTVYPPLAAGDEITLIHTATIDGNIGSGTTLTNRASVEYTTQADGSGRHVVRTTDTADVNTDDETIDVERATISKAITGPNPATVGDEVEYVLTVTVPAETIAYLPSLQDVVDVDGMEYVTGSTALAGTDLSGITFRSTSEPVIVQTSPGLSLLWEFNTIDNTGTDEDLVFELRFRLHVAGVASGDDDILDNWLWWPPGVSDQINDQGTFSWHQENDEESTLLSASSEELTTDVHQPYLVLDKTRNVSTVRGGDTISYTVTIDNTGQSAAHRVVVIDDLPLGLSIEDVSADVTVTLAGASLTQGVDYTVSFDSVTRRLTVDLDSTTVPAGSRLVIRYDVLVVGGIGAGSTLTNIASVEYSSRADDPARTIVHTDDPADDNTDSTNVNVVNATIGKTIIGPNPATIGDEVEYALTVTVPAGTFAYMPDVADILFHKGMSYVVGSAYLSVDPGGIVFTSGSPEPVIVQTTAGMRLEWNLETIDNTDPYDQNLTFEIRFRLLVTGEDASSDWLWWPPGTDDQVLNRGRFRWRLEDDASLTPRTQLSSNRYTDIDQPYLTLVKGNDAAGALAGGDEVTYTLSIINSGQSAAHRLNILDTLPKGVEDVTVNSLFLGGAPLDPADYSVLWNSAANLLTIDIIPGLGAGQDLLVVYTATLGDVMPSGSILTNIASVAYNSQGDGSGRQVELSLDVDDANTDDSTFSIIRAEIDKSHDAVGNQATIGEEFTYTIQVTIPADTVIYNAEVTDTIADGLAVLETSTAVGTISVVPQPGGSTLVTWDIGEYVNDTDNPVTLELTIDVRVLKQFADETPVSGLLPSPDDFSNLASLTWENALLDGDSYSDSDTAPPITVVEPVLTISKGWENLTHPGQQPEAGDVVLYTITVENQGTSAAYQVEVSDPLSGWVTYIPGTIIGPGADDSDLDDLAWDIGTVNAGEALTLQYWVEINAGISWGQNLDNTATLQEHYSLPQPNEHAREYGALEATAPATARAAGLVVDKSIVGSNTVRWGEVILYRVTITNVGDAAAYDVNMTDNIAHPHIQYILGSTSIVWPDGSSTDDPAGVGTATLEWIINAQIGPGQSLVLDYHAQSPAGTDYDWYTNTISAGGTDGGGTAIPGDSGIPADTDPDDLDTASVLVSNPDIVVTKAFAGANDYIPVGNTLTYTIRVENTGNTTIPEVPLADTFNADYLSYVTASILPDTIAAGSLSWNDITGGDELAPGEFVEVTVEFTALAVGLTPDTDNTASVSTVDEHGNPVSDSDTDDTLIITNPGITVTKTFASVNEYIPVGNTLTYTIRVENTGNTTIPVVPLNDTFNADYMSYVTASILPDTIAAGSLSWNDITGGDELAPGEFVEVTVEFTALAVGLTPDTDNTAAVSTVDEHGNPVSDSDIDDSLTITNPSVAVNKELALDQPGTVLVGESVVFHITITNVGNTDLMEIPLEDAFDSAVLEFLTSSLLPSDIGDSLIQWDDILVVAGIDRLEPGESINMLLTFRAFDVTPATVNSVSVSGAVDEHGNNPPDTQDSETIEIPPNPDGLSVEKGSDPPHNTPVLPGDTITFTIVIENILDVPIYGITIEDYIEPAAEFVPGSLELNGAVLDDSHYNNDTRLVTVQIGTLLPGETATLMFQVEVAEYDKAVPDVVNVATVDSPQTGVIESDPPVVLPVDPFILTKEVTNISGEGLNPGDILEWVITVRNIGHAPTVNIIVTDEIPEFTVYVEGSIGGPGADDSTPGVLVWNVGSLDVGEEVVLVFRTRVNDDLESGLVIANQAFLTSDQIVGEKPSSGPGGLHTPTTITVMPRTGTNIKYFWYGGLLLLIIGLGGLAAGLLRREE